MKFDDGPFALWKLERSLILLVLYNGELIRNNSSFHLNSLERDSQYYYPRKSATIKLRTVSKGLRFCLPLCVSIPLKFRLAGITGTRKNVHYKLMNFLRLWTKISSLWTLVLHQPHFIYEIYVVAQICYCLFNLYTSFITVSGNTYPAFEILFGLWFSRKSVFSLPYLVIRTPLPWPIFSSKLSKKGYVIKIEEVWLFIRKGCWKISFHCADVTFETLVLSRILKK